MTLRTSVLVPSFRRPDALRRCLDALRCQTTAADEVLVIWQGDDTGTRDVVEAAKTPEFRVRALHNEVCGVVPAENAALDASIGEIILLIDDDALAPPDWVQRHLRAYSDPTVGAVGGPAVNHRPDGSPFPTRSAKEFGKLRWWGKVIGNMFDHPDAWRSREAIDVDHLVGYNMSLRRSAFSRFEAALRPYWQLFELDACLQVKARGYRVRFDFRNVVQHYPTNTAYAGGRDGDLQIKVYNAAYNHSYILTKHRSSFVSGLVQRVYAYAVGSVSTPGLLGAAVAMARYGNPGREARVFWNTLKSRRAAQRDARRAQKP